jgi:hypothetical protein
MVRDLLGLGGSRMDGVFQAAPLLGLLRMLVRGFSIAARPVAWRKIAIHEESNTRELPF